MSDLVLSLGFIQKPLTILTFPRMLFKSSLTIHSFIHQCIYLFKIYWTPAPKNWCFWTVVSEKNLESPLDCKEIQPVHSEGDQPWVFFGRNDGKAEAPVLWPPHAKSWLIGKKPWFWEGLRARGEGDNRGWDGWMISPTQWTWVWANSRRWWRTGKPGILQRVR